MSILSCIAGIAIGSIATIIYLSKEYNKCKDLLSETKDKLNKYRKSNKELLEMVTHLRQEVINNEQS